MSETSAKELERERAAVSEALILCVREQPEAADVLGELGLIVPLARPNKAAKPELEPGATGKYVEEAQKDLQRLGYDVPASGSFGDKTVLAVLAFQQDSDIPQTGYIDAATWSALDKASGQARTTQTFTDLTAFFKPVSAAVSSYVTGAGEEAAIAAAVPEKPKSITQQTWFWPVVIIGGLVVVGGVAYAATR